MGTFTLTRLAKADLRTMARYTEKKWGRLQRRHYLKGMDEAFGMLADSPKLGVGCDYIEMGLRKYHFQSHVIFYEFTQKTTIQVVRVLHKSMDVQQAAFSS